METVRLAALELDTVVQTGDADAEWRACFPFSPDSPGEMTADVASDTVVYNELDPGKRIGQHRDAVDEHLLVLTGTVEATVDDETEPIDTGSLAVIPATTPHSVENIGSETARLIGFFGTNPVESAFTNEPQVVTETEE